MWEICAQITLFSLVSSLCIVYRIFDLIHVAFLGLKIRVYSRIRGISSLRFTETDSKGDREVADPVANWLGNRCRSWHSIRRSDVYRLIRIPHSIVLNTRSYGSTDFDFCDFLCRLLADSCGWKNVDVTWNPYVWHINGRFNFRLTDVYRLLDFSYLLPKWWR